MESHGESRPAVPTFEAGPPAAPSRPASALRWIVANVESVHEAIDWSLDSLNAQEATMPEQRNDHGMTVVEPDREAPQAAMKSLDEKYDSVWTEELREKTQAFK
jgi:hypothetical protein